MYEKLRGKKYDENDDGDLKGAPSFADCELLYNPFHTFYTRFTTFIRKCQYIHGVVIRLLDI